MVSRAEQFTRMLSMLRVMFLIVVVEGIVSNKMEAMRGFILHQSNPPCRDVETNKLMPCTLTGQEDYQKLMSVNSANPSAPGQLKIGCKDGSNNMTCLPLSLIPVRYYCACASEKGDLNTEIEWNNINVSVWEVITESGLAIKRSLCDVQAGWCLDGMFTKNLAYFVELYAPLDSQITVSSTRDWQYSVNKIRFTYTGSICGWIKGRNDQSPWLKFDFLQDRVAIGVKIGKQCDIQHYYVKSFHVSSSVDDLAWSAVGVDEQALYVGTICHWWFDREISARYWFIQPLEFSGFPSMQADVIGYI